MGRTFPRIAQLPPYVFQVITELKTQARKAGEDIVDLGMGNPDQPPPQEIIEKMKSALDNPKNHRYSVSRGIYRLRVEICNWYRERFSVELDPDREAVVTMGSKEGLAHLMFAILEPGVPVIVPDPTYPIHTYSVVIAEGKVVRVPLNPLPSFLSRVEETVLRSSPSPRALILNFPHNPTTAVVDKEFFSRVVEIARKYDLIVIHDLAYGDLVFDGYSAPSFLSVPGGKEVGVEIFTLSKSLNMPGWRVGFVVGREDLIYALSRLKSYLDYGIFQPVQIASIIALQGYRRFVPPIVETYRRRRDVLIAGLNRIGWEIPPPKGTMFVWAEIPPPFKEMGSLKFAELLLKEGKVAVSPGVGFGPEGEGFVRFALVENEHRLRQAVDGIRHLFKVYRVLPSRRFA
jgi:alanine-synthesizing transaminase